MAKILSKLFGLNALSQMRDSGLQPTGNAPKTRKRGNVSGDLFYKFLSFKRKKDGSWGVRK